MGERTEYAPGTFSWADLSTTDQVAAKAFYSGLFGWEAEDLPIGDDMSYSMMRLGGRAVAAIGPQQETQRAAGVPPVWNSYVTVRSVDDAADRAATLGATLLAPPFDVMAAGRMAVVQDPQGAIVSLWEARESIGAELVNVPGTLCWNELVTADVDAATGFYGAMFGWTFEPMEGNRIRYLIIRNGERANGGVREPPGTRAELRARVLRHRRHRRRRQPRPAARRREPLRRDRRRRRPARRQVGDPQGAVFGLYDGPLED